MRDTRGFGNVEAVMAGGPPEPPALCSGALPGSVCVGFPLRGLLVGLPKLVHSTLIHGIKPATRPCGRQAGWRARGNTRVLGAGQPGLGGSGPVGETGVGLPCALLPFLEWSGQTSAPEAAAGSCTHAEAGARARAPDTRSAGPCQPHALPSRGRRARGAVRQTVLLRRAPGPEPTPPPGAGLGPHSPPLAQVHEEHHIVPEAGQPVGGGHGDDKGEHVVDEGVEGLRVGGAVRPEPPGHAGTRRP